jgi:transposase-like protein
MERRRLKAAEMLWEAKDEILVNKTFPREHHRTNHADNLFERLNYEIKQRERVLDVFTDRS